MIPPMVSLKGDQVRAGALKGFALSQLRILHNAMSFQNLKQDVRRISFADGSAVEVRSNWGLDSVKIFAPVVPARVEEVEVEVGLPIYIEPEEEEEVEVTPESYWSPIVVLYRRGGYQLPIKRAFPGEVTIQRDDLRLWGTMIFFNWAWIGPFTPDMTIVVTELSTVVLHPVPFIGKFFGRLGEKTLIREGVYAEEGVYLGGGSDVGGDYIELGYELPVDRDNWQVWEYSSMTFGIDLVEYSDLPGGTSEEPPGLCAMGDDWSWYTIYGRVWIEI